MTPTRLLALLAVSHAAADGAAGWLLGTSSQTQALSRVTLLLLVYNGLAFAGQPIAGWITDRVRRPDLAAAAGLALLMIALPLLGIAPAQDRIRLVPC